MEKSNTGDNSDALNVVLRVVGKENAQFKDKEGGVPRTIFRPLVIQSSETLVHSQFGILRNVGLTKTHDVDSIQQLGLTGGLGRIPTGKRIRGNEHVRQTLCLA